MQELILIKPWFQSEGAAYSQSILLLLKSVVLERLCHELILSFLSILQTDTQVG